MLSDDVDVFIFVLFAVADGVGVDSGYVVYPVALFNGVSADIVAEVQFGEYLLTGVITVSFYVFPSSTLSAKNQACKDSKS